MKEKLIKKIIMAQLIDYRRGAIELIKRHPQDSLFDLIKKGYICRTHPSMDRRDDYVKQMRICMSKINIEKDVQYIYPYDTYVYRKIPKDILSICSLTLDYSKVIESSLSDLKIELGMCSDKSFSNRQIAMAECVEDLGNRIGDILGESDIERQIVLKNYFPQMLYRRPQSLDEAIQKLLFYDALYWQANHWHIGLGRLDKILYPYYRYDMDHQVITRSQAEEMIYEMCRVLGKDTRTKSASDLVGDTGQYILLGGVDENGETVQNELTEIFLEIFKDYKHTDPKLILRVNENTSDIIWSKAIDSILSGHGSPLIMNENPIMESMRQFGYEEKDLCQVGTSACWEPLIIGKSFDQNNSIASFCMINILNDFILKDGQYETFGKFYQGFKDALAEKMKYVRDVNFDCSPLFSLFMDDCIKKEEDFTHGGARYAYHGIQIISFPNLVNALLNIQKYVFEDKLISLSDCKNVILTDYEGREDLLTLFKHGNLKFGSTNSRVLELTNELMEYIGNLTESLRSNGERLKVGFSSPEYMFGKNAIASLDGRKAGDPFAVHISPISSGIDIAEVLDFASRLNYSGNRINGNVVDFIIPQSYAQNKDKLKTLIRNACHKGIFELQLNVLNYSELVDAKLHPEKYPHLMVRVWGFSAYFNDLPEEYKDNLIERAKLYEAS